MATSVAVMVEAKGAEADAAAEAAAADAEAGGSERFGGVGLGWSSRFLRLRTAETRLRCERDAQCTLHSCAPFSVRSHHSQ